MDYACGWGRFASLILKYGPPEQLDMADAWPKSVEFAQSSGYKNNILKVSELLKDGDLKENEYSFIISFSLFTHLNEDAVRHNLEMLARSLKPGGKVYFTVRHENFFDHKFSEKAREYRGELAKNNGFWFKSSGGDQTQQGLFGDSVMSEIFLKNLNPGKLDFRFLGDPTPLRVIVKSGV